MAYYSTFLIFRFSFLFAEYTENSYIPNIVATTVSLIFMISFSFLPESPRFLCFKRETNSARDIVAKFKDIDADVEETLRIWSQREQIVDKNPVKVLFDGNLQPKQLVTLFGLVIFEQLIGAISALFYMHKILNLTRTTLKISFFESPILNHIEIFHFHIHRWRIYPRNNSDFMLCNLYGRHCLPEHLQLYRQNENSISMVQYMHGYQFGSIGHLLSLSRNIWRNRRLQSHAVGVLGIVLFLLCHWTA